jgi:hypothetical protein
VLPVLGLSDTALLEVSADLLQPLRRQRLSQRWQELGLLLHLREEPFAEQALPPIVVA